MGATTAGMVGWANSANNLYLEQKLVDPGRSHAVVAWIGYETPPVPIEQGGLQVLGIDYAQAGAEKLDHAMEGFVAARPDADLSIVAHSYGTPTAALALSEGGVQVDSFVSIGSAGLPPEIDQARDLHATEVFAGQARDVLAVDPAGGDQWAWTGRLSPSHPVNPIGESFGAHAFGTDTGVGGAPVRDHGVDAGGGGYLDVGTESLTNVAYATTGHGAQATPHVTPEPTPLQQAMIDQAKYGYGY
jgi:pimeloyl-ACP methyl ester carboxylesterase